MNDRKDKALEDIEEGESIFEFIKGGFIDPLADLDHDVLSDSPEEINQLKLLNDPEGETLYGYPEELDENQTNDAFWIPEDDNKESKRK